MDFATLPPEVNSGLMYAGPGSGPIIAAAASWDSLASRGVLGGRRLRVGDLRSHQRSVARPGVGVHGGRRRTIRVVDECHRRASRTGRRPSQSGGQCLRSRVHRDGCAAGHRCQPDVVGIIGRLQHPRPEHPGDRDDRSPLRRDVGPRRRGDVRLRRILRGRIDIDAVRRAAGDHHGRSGSWHGNIGAAVAVGDFGPRCTARARLARDVDVGGVGSSGAFGFTSRTNSPSTTGFSGFLQ